MGVPSLSKVLLQPGLYQRTTELFLEVRVRVLRKLPLFLAVAERVFPCMVLCHQCSPRCEIPITGQRPHHQ